MAPREAQAVLDGMAGRDVHCTPDEAAEFAGRLIGFYPARPHTDPKTFVFGLSMLFEAFPLDFVKRVCNPVTGLPSKQPFFPALAEVRTALDCEADRRKRIAANAKFVIEQAERREREAREEAAWQAQRVPPDVRAAQVQALLKGGNRL